MSSPSLQEVRELLSRAVPPGRADEDQVRRLWWAALATLQNDLLPAAPDQRGLWLAAPLPALSEPALLRRLDGWVWVPEAVGRLLPAGAPLLPTAGEGPGGHGPALAAGFERLPLAAKDGTDPLLVLITAQLQVALALVGPAGSRQLVVRFEADVIAAALDLLVRRLQRDDAASAGLLRQQLQGLQGEAGGHPGQPLGHQGPEAQTQARIAVERAKPLQLLA
ncbi:MAG: hypothetical protein ACKOPN_08625, partial [Prochlorococcaceae cyanobacterium]